MGDNCNISKICRILSYVIFVLGLIGSSYISDTLGKSIDYGLYTISYERDWSLTILYFVIGCFSTALLGMVFLGMAEIMDRIEEVKNRLENIEIKSSDKNQTTNVNRVDVHEEITEDGKDKPAYEVVTNNSEAPIRIQYVTPPVQTYQSVKHVDKYGDEELEQEEQSEFIKIIKKYQIPIIIVAGVMFFAYFYMNFIA